MEQKKKKKKTRYTIYRGTNGTKTNSGINSEKKPSQVKIYFVQWFE